MKNISWIQFDGGPLLLAPRSRVRDWGGIGSGSDAPSDYDRACAMDDEIGGISIGDRSAVVLGDEPDRTALVGGGADDVFLIRWKYARSEQSLVGALFADNLIRRLPYVPAGWIATDGEEYVLFSPAYDGSDIGPHLSVVLRAGRYFMGTAKFEPNSETSAVIHRLTNDNGTPTASRALGL